MNKNILAVFAGYDKHNIIDDYVVYYIKELNKTADIIYVADNNMTESEIKKISQYCIKTITEKHGEYDFGSYKRGFEFAEKNDLLKNYDNIIFCNDSMYGPFCDLGPIIYDLIKCDFSGIVLGDNPNVASHKGIASYFLILSKKVFLSDFFHDFIYNIKKEKSKLDVIEKYEIGLSKLMSDNNIEFKGLFNEVIDRAYEDPLSIISEGFPFFKKLLLEQAFGNWSGRDQYIKIMNIIKKNYDINLIVNHLNRVSTPEMASLIYNRFDSYKKVFISDKILTITGKYAIHGKYQTIFKLFNSLTITINKSLQNSYRHEKFENFNFLLTEQNRTEQNRTEQNRTEQNSNIY